MQWSCYECERDLDSTMYVGPMQEPGGGGTCARERSAYSLGLDVLRWAVELRIGGCGVGFCAWVFDELRAVEHGDVGYVCSRVSDLRRQHRPDPSEEQETAPCKLTTH